MVPDDLPLATCQGFRRPDGGSPDRVRPAPTRLVSPPPGAPPIAAGLRCGISDSGGGGIGVVVHGASASATASGVWKRPAGSLAISFSRTAAISTGTSARIDRTGLGWRVWCQISFCATEPSANGGRPVRMK